MEYVMDTFRNKFPEFFNIIDKKSEKILYRSVEKLKRVRITSMEDFQNYYNKSIEDIIADANLNTKN